MGFWRKCSTCKNEIAYQTAYYTCSVSSCNTKRTGLVFCTIPCFDSHVPGARHKSAGAIEERAPKKEHMSSEKQNHAQQESRPPQRRIVSKSAGPSAIPKELSVSGGEILVVASRFKDFIQKQGNMNTSANVMPELSDHLRAIGMRAIDNARNDGRKTIMARDFAFLKK